MQPYRYDIKKFLVISATIGIASNAAFSAGTSALGLPYGFSIGFATSVIGLFWVLFDRILWRWKILKFLGISDLPDLNGLWVGNVDRLGEGNPHRFEMLIFQTYSKLSIQTNSSNSKANSVFSGFLVDETGRNFDIVNYWICRTKSLDPSLVHDESFTGLSRIDIRLREGKILLEDYYFTDRNPSTRGKTVLNRLVVDSAPRSSLGGGEAKLSWFRRLFRGKGGGKSAGLEPSRVHSIDVVQHED